MVLVFHGSWSGQFWEIEAVGVPIGFEYHTCDVKFVPLYDVNIVLDPGKLHVFGAFVNFEPMAVATRTPFSETAGEYVNVQHRTPTLRGTS